MSSEYKKLAVFGMILSMLTSTYVSLLGTLIRQGFGTENFIYNWFNLVPKAYLAVLPFVLIAGPIVRRFVDWLFFKLTQDKKHRKEG